MQATIHSFLKEFHLQESRFRDDIHIDRLDGKLRDRKLWVDGGIACLSSAQSIRNDEGLYVVVAMEFFLASAQTQKGFPEASIQEMELSWTPPALVAYKPGSEPWLVDRSFQLVHPFVSGSDSQNIGVFFQEWYDDAENDYDRRLWLV